MRTLHVIAFIAILCAPPAAYCGEVTARLAGSGDGRKHAKTEHQAPAVIWLKPLVSIPTPPPTTKYTLMQKEKMFLPHLLVVPVGSAVYFPNADPFFHNVFSLFDGKRFDLGLYEAGSTRFVTFTREGISYIFCNIHPDMSAVVLSLTTPYYSTADTNGVFHIRDVPPGEYDLHVWVEGRREDVLNSLTRRVHVSGTSGDLGLIEPGPRDQPGTHLNKFGRPYEPETNRNY